MTDLDLNDVAIVNNSRESFTPTISGAIATCVWEICRVAAESGRGTPLVVTGHTAADDYEWSRIARVDRPPLPTGPRLTVVRAARRATGWARVGQRAYARNVLSVLQRMDARYVVCNNDPEVAAYLHDHLPKAKIVHWFHNVEPCSDQWRRRFVRSPRLRWVAVSRYLAQAVARVYDVEAARVIPVLNGVDAQRFRPATNVRGRDRVTVGFVGRIAVEKAPDLLVRACLRLARSNIPLRLQLVGDTNWGSSQPGPFLTLLQSLCDELVEAGAEVDWRGHVERAGIADALRDTDIHVAPSRWDEPCGLTVLEGLATGVPVVGSAAGGIPELLPDNVTLFPREDDAALADVLRRLIGDVDLRIELGFRARKRAMELSWGRTLDGVLSAFE